MPPAALYAVDLVAVSILTFGLYFPRHRRRDLVVAYLGVNVGVLAVAATLATSSVGAGLGLGLFGVLSIIRLRSSEIGQSEIAYYFAALAIGLVCGLSTTFSWLSVGLVALIVVVLAVIDSPAMLRRSREQVMVLDRAYTDEDAATAAVEQLLGCPVHGITIRSVDLVSDTTTVDVRYARPREARAVARPATAQHAQREMVSR